MRAADEHERLLRHRLRAQRIAPRAADDVTVGDLVGSVCGVQAQEKPAAALSVRARRRGLTATDVERALYDERSVVRTWCMRGTFHLVATEDLPWLLAVFGPTFATRGPDPRRLAELGFDEKRVEAVVETIGEVLADAGPLTREDIAEHLVDHGIEVDPTTQTVYHLIRRRHFGAFSVRSRPSTGRTPTIASIAGSTWTLHPITTTRSPRSPGATSRRTDRRPVRTSRRGAVSTRRT